MQGSKIVVMAGLLALLANGATAQGPPPQSQSMRLTVSQAEQIAIRNNPRYQCGQTGSDGQP